jgi:hypothetical protein
MLKALKIENGVVQRALQHIKIGTQEHYKWMKEDEEYVKKVIAIDEQLISLAEMKLVEFIERGDLKAIMFFLSRKGRSRGWGDRIDMKSLNEGGSLSFQIGEPIKINYFIPTDPSDPDNSEFQKVLDGVNERLGKN